MGLLEILQLIGAAGEIAGQLGAVDKIIATARAEGRSTTTPAETELLRTQAPAVHAIAMSNQQIMQKVLAG